MSIHSTRYRIPEDILFQELSGEAVLLNLSSGQYYSLDDIGTRMWSLIAKHGEIEPVISTLLLEYEVAESQLRADLDKLITEFTNQGLLTRDET
jgi:hypothetical protein